MKEDFLYYLWSYYLKGQDLKTVDDYTVVIDKPGRRNVNSGPDFFDARVRINGTLWAGNVEIHVNGSDWFKHHHHLDPAYSNVLLHVVYECDVPVYRKNGSLIPCIELKPLVDGKLYETYQKYLLSKQWISCASDIQTVDHFVMYNWLQRLAFERLEEKATEIKNQLVFHKGDFQEVFYKFLMRAYGFNVNSTAFEQLAHSLPYPLLLKHKNDLLQLEALLLGQAGLLPEKPKESYVKQLAAEYKYLSEKYELKPLSPARWKFMRLRPSNFPTLRMAQIAQLIYRTSGLLDSILTASEMHAVYDLFTARTSQFWSTHYTFKRKHAHNPKKMGRASIFSLFINTIIPFVFVYGDEMSDRKMKEKALHWLSKIPTEHNAITRNFEKMGVFVQHAAQSQALLQLKTNYCNKKRCLECTVGHQLLKATS